MRTCQPRRDQAPQPEPPGAPIEPPVHGQRRRLVGGRTHTLGRRPSALFAYRTASGRQLICQMYEGTLAQLPAAGETREHNAITFRVYRSGVLTLVFWQEGDVVCVLVFKGNTDEVLQLAYAKAVKV